MDFIFIDEFRVSALVGIYPREKIAPQPVELSISFGVPECASQRDHIADTINYAVVMDRIRAELAERHFNLLESLGEFIVALLFEEFDAPWVELRLAKIGVMKSVRRVGVVLRRAQEGRTLPDGLPFRGSSR